MPSKPKPEPSSKSRRGYHHGDLRRALLDAAVELIAEKGAEGLTLRGVARRVGVTHGAAYRHFDDKDALLAGVAERGYLGLRNAMRRAPAGRKELAVRLDAMARAHLRYAYRHPAQYQLMFGPRLNESGRFPELEAAIDAILEIFQQELCETHGIEDRRARELTIGLLIMVHGYCQLILTKRVRVRSRRRAEDHLRRLMRPFLIGMLAEIEGPHDAP